MMKHDTKNFQRQHYFNNNTNLLGKGGGARPGPPSHDLVVTLVFYPRNGTHNPMCNLESLSWNKAMFQIS